MVRMTPMLQQYLEIKAQNPDAVLFYRMGDFYEMFLEDAELSAPILQIALTSRNKNDEAPIPMCGVPHHSAAVYIRKLVEKGYKVAVCEQVEDPSTAKGVVKREVVRVVTPGVQTEPEALRDDQSNFVSCISLVGDRYGLAYLDVSTGDFRSTSVGSLLSTLDEFGRVSPAELLLDVEFDPGSEDQAFAVATSSVVVTRVGLSSFDLAQNAALLRKKLAVENLEGLGIADSPEQISAAASVLRYVMETQKNDIGHVTELRTYRLSDAMILDESAKRNLELVESLSRKSRRGSLIDVLDHTATAMGARLLRDWICRPLLKARPILERLDAVEELAEGISLRETVIDLLKKVYDLERLNARVALARAHPRDLLALRDSFQSLPALQEYLLEFHSSLLKRIATSLDTLDDLAEMIAKTIRDDAPISLAEGGVIRKGVDPELDRYLDATRNNKEWIAALEAREKAATGIPSLKVGYNKVFGYYIEITRTHFDKIPPEYIRKQTLVNAERFITEELKDRETIILEAREKQTRLEHDLFVSLRESVAVHSSRIRSTAELLARLDVLSSLAHAAQLNGYVKPQILDTGEISIREGRHPVVEKSLPPGEFVPNDVRLDMEGDQILVVTGPNMAGKSTILRQTALITLMAQIGSFVPALEAAIGLVDRIFTRIGASDDLFRGYSTFMIEMVETATIVHQSTPRSLVILDEIGRGTSTVDGLSIAWAVVEYLHNRRGRGVKTLFATHYHELTGLSRLLPRVKNFNIAVKEWQGNVLFLRKLVRGGASHSYGIEVARLAGLPRSIIDRSREILGELESCGLPELSGLLPGKTRRSAGSRSRQVPFEFLEKEPGPLEKRLDELNPDMLSPREAMQVLYELKQLLGKTP